MTVSAHFYSRAAQWSFAFAALAISGCASITGSEFQSVTVVTHTPGGLPINQASCKLENDKGGWFLISPGSVVLQRSAADLSIACEKEGQPPGLGKAISRPNGGMFGNIIFGGVVGAIIDHNNGNAYDYPNLFNIEMGTTQTFGVVSGNTLEQPDK